MRQTRVGGRRLRRLVTVVNAACAHSCGRRDEGSASHAAARSGLGRSSGARLARLARSAAARPQAHRTGPLRLQEAVAELARAGTALSVITEAVIAASDVVVATRANPILVVDARARICGTSSTRCARAWSAASSASLVKCLPPAGAGVGGSAIALGGRSVFVGASPGKLCHTH